ncbi:H(+)/Cl(-) exchange transporter 3 [Hypsizygus marmoreus]|uniref:H(+)/Cl(-) exchange transporter 3 n=1 Tax=Hypsizygus marmoreus TaxID=39966 RepID=A0A369JTR4_HYPMA|nr:H(+)/Cl(-) exchange transporter 3 [Hypsizygus marmoreus]
MAGYFGHISMPLEPVGRNGHVHTDEELFELTEDGQLPTKYGKRTKYEDGSSIDWLHEEAAERERLHSLRSQAGARGLLLPLLESARLWFVVIMTGLGIGITGAWLDVLVKWLGDLREGHCSYGFFYNQVACCSGLDPGEQCHEWLTWSESLHIRSIFVQSLLQCFIYVVLAIAFAGSAALLVETYAPYAFHTGIPEIKAILGGYVFDAFLTPWTLLIKALGLALAVASGLSLGKEGPLVHVACCMAFGLSRFFRQFNHNEAQKRKLLAAAAAAGVSVAFGSPLGGVLFGLEELDTFANETDVMWKGFVASAVAAVALQWVNPFGTAKLVLFQVTNAVDTWRAFELIPWLGLGVVGGVLGALLIRLNVEVALYRRNSYLNDWPVLEVVCVSAITAGISYLETIKVVFSRVQASELVANLFQECDPTKGDYHGLCNPTAMWENVFLLILTAIIKIGLTAWTFGMMVPAGIFLPTIAIGACLGRAVGLMTQGLYRAHPTAWIFLSCPPDPSERCISPGFYAVLGASAMLGGVTRMTISLVVIVFELTGALSHVLPIMICVMTAKWVGDALGKDGIYSVWIAMRRYPWLPAVDYHDKGETGANIMRSLEKLVTIEDERFTVAELEQFLETYDFNGFPIVREKRLVGFATRDKLKESLDPFAQGDAFLRSKRCSFSIRDSVVPEDTRADLSECLEEAVLQLRKEVPQELVVSMFQKLNLRRILFTHAGELTGMTTKSDVVALLTSHFPHTAALSQRPTYSRAPS